MSVEFAKPQMSLRALIGLVCLSALIWAVFGGLMTGLVASQGEESLLFNCYISGNMQCGESAVWHGFVNF
jgi:hypothetical protein